MSIIGVDEVLVLSCPGHVLVPAGWRRQRCVKCGVTMVLRWWSLWDEHVVRIVSPHGRVLWSAQLAR
jgi:hypothetical protein